MSEHTLQDIEEMSVDAPSVWACGEMVPRNDVVSIVVSAHAHNNKIKDHTFSKCSELNKVVLNEGVQRIGRNAFSYCESLEYITLPSTVTEIDNYAFQHCTKLKEKCGPTVVNKRRNNLYEYRRIGEQRVLLSCYHCL